MIISQTPLRISFVGGGTDQKEFWKNEKGAVLSSTIDKYIYVIVKKRFDELIVVNYRLQEVVNCVSEIKHDLVRNCLKKVGITSGIEITTLADIPSEGSGLGSSSTVTVGLLNALYTYCSKQVTAEQLAQEACEIEIDILGKPIGKQDQYIAAYGGLREISFNPNGTVKIESISNHNFPKLVFSSNLLLFYTNITRQSSDILTIQKAEIKNKIDILRQMRDQVPHVRKVLESEDNNDNVGIILNKAWTLKKQLAKTISSPLIDEMYQKAIDAGALGGKISGAGGGGFLLVYVQREKQNDVRQAMSDYMEFPFMFESDGSKIIFNITSNYWK